jgi:predicted SnoaL-like aldol condensation-catalyzing enzyme
MKKLFFPAIVFGLFSMMSCQNKKDDTTSTTAATTSVDSKLNETNKARMDACNTVSNAFQTGDVSKIDDVIAKDFVDHTDMGDMKGTDSLKAMIKTMHAKMKDPKTETLKQAVSGDYVYNWMRYTGTSDGSMGMPAGPYDMSAIELVKFNNENKAVEHWAFMEMRDMMKMMKTMPPPTKK